MRAGEEREEAQSLGTGETEKERQRENEKLRRRLSPAQHLRVPVLRTVLESYWTGVSQCSCLLADMIFTPSVSLQHQFVKYAMS